MKGGVKPTGAELIEEIRGKMLTLPRSKLYNLLEEISKAEEDYMKYRKTVDFWKIRLLLQ